MNVLTQSPVPSLLMLMYTGSEFFFGSSMTPPSFACPSPAKAVVVIDDPTKIPLPVDISINKDGTGLWVNTFMDGKTRYFDLSNPEQPKQTYERVTGKQVNMISQSWDGTRVYVASSLLANWDKGGADNEQFVRAFRWDGKALTPAFEVDFNKEKLGRAHHMKLGSKAMKAAYGSDRTAALR